MSNEWRTIEGEKWGDTVGRVLAISRSEYLESWEIEGQIALEFERIVAKDAEIERLRGGVVAEIQRLNHLNDNAVARIAFLEKALVQAANRHIWYCGRGAFNGVNLNACGRCRRDRADSEIAFEQEKVK